MTNTVLITAKGNNAVILFIGLVQLYPHATWHTPKSKWWHSETRHELRIQNLPFEEIAALAESLNTYWPLSSRVRVSVF